MLSRRRRLRARWRASTAPAGWCRRRTRRAWARRCRRCWPTRTSATRLERAARRGGRGGPLLVGPDRGGATLTRCYGGWRAMRVVFMGKHKRSAVRRARALVRAGLRGRRGRGAASRTAAPSSPSAWTSPPSATACRWSSDDDLYAAIERGELAGGRPGALVPVLEAHPAAADRARPHRLPELPPRAAARHARPRRLQRRDPRGLRRVGRLRATSSTRTSTPATSSRSTASRSTASTRPPCRSTSSSQERLLALFQRVIDDARCAASRCRARRRARAATSRSEEFERLRARARRATDVERSGARLLVPALPTARRSRWTGGAVTLVDRGAAGGGRRRALRGRRARCP